MTSTGGEYSHQAQHVRVEPSDTVSDTKPKSDDVDVR